MRRRVSTPPTSPRRKSGHRRIRGSALSTPQPQPTNSRGRPLSRSPGRRRAFAAPTRSSASLFTGRPCPEFAPGSFRRTEPPEEPEAGEFPRPRKLQAPIPQVQPIANAQRRPHRAPNRAAGRTIRQWTDVAPSRHSASPTPHWPTSQNPSAPIFHGLFYPQTQHSPLKGVTLTTKAAEQEAFSSPVRPASYQREDPIHDSTIARRDRN